MFLPTPIALVWSLYFTLGSFLELMIQKGGWDKYLLIPRKMSYEDYQRHLFSSCRDLFIILPMAYHLAKSRILLGPEQSIVFYDDLLLNIPKVLCAVCVGYGYRMLIHYCMHFRWLFRNLHSQHHVPLPTLNSFVCFQDSVFENIFMEIVGVFILPALLVPVPPAVLSLIWCYGVYTGLLDHSCLYIHDKWWIAIDCRYHFNHHLKPSSNYAELECLDRLAGTYKKFKPFATTT
jgi:sterol desaturase/sphingolipid hydroxylase (fatty acid hydroxylase superfamily)